MTSIATVKCPFCGSEDVYCYTKQGNPREAHAVRARAYWRINERQAPVASVKRATSVYAFVVEGEYLDAMVKRLDSLPAQRAGAWTEDGNTVILFRCDTDDEYAKAMAEHLVRAADATGPNQLTTGMGLHRRLVAQI